MLCVCTKKLCVCDTELVCKAVRLAFSSQNCAITLPFILVPWYQVMCICTCTMYNVQFMRICALFNTKLRNSWLKGFYNVFFSNRNWISFFSVILLEEKVNIYSKRVWRPATTIILIRAIFSAFSHPSHLEILIICLSCVFKFLIIFPMESTEKNLWFSQ